MISKDVLPKLINAAEQKFGAQLPQLKKLLLERSKSKDTKNMARKYFQTAAEELNIKLGEETLHEPATSNGHNTKAAKKIAQGHERTQQDEIFNHVMVEEGYNTHSPLEDVIKINGKHHIVNLAEEDDDDIDEPFVDPYEDLTEEEVRARMPPYFNKSHKQKKKFFKTLNRQYLSKLHNPKKGETGDKPRVNFDLKKNAIKKFKKSQKVSV